MCLLIVLVASDPAWPLIVGSNRDEVRERQASPPGLWLGERRRVLAPRDRRAGGTWIGINDRGLFAGLTNLGAHVVPDPPTSRGRITHLALDSDDLENAVGAVTRAVTAEPYSGFQLVLSDGDSLVILEHEHRQLVRRDIETGYAVVGNRHRHGELALPGLPLALEPGLDVGTRLARLRTILLDPGEHDGHKVLKTGGAYGTVSSSLIARRAESVRGLVWRYAAGPPDEAPYRDYGNLSRRLLDES
jgi:uncharacterized protein with NRDE domain